MFGVVDIHRKSASRIARHQLSATDGEADFKIHCQRLERQSIKAARATGFARHLYLGRSRPTQARIRTADGRKRAGEQPERRE